MVAGNPTALPACHHPGRQQGGRTGGREGPHTTDDLHGRRARPLAGCASDVYGRGGGYGHGMFGKDPREPARGVRERGSSGSEERPEGARIQPNIEDRQDMQALRAAIFGHVYM